MIHSKKDQLQRRKKKTRNPDEEKRAYQEATERARDPEGFLRCERCDKSMLDHESHRHHTIYRSHGGETTPENIEILCTACHQGPRGIHQGPMLQWLPDNT